jgi:hypothetical protein
VQRLYKLPSEQVHKTGGGIVGGYDLQCLYTIIRAPFLNCLASDPSRARGVSHDKKKAGVTQGVRAVRALLVQPSCTSRRLIQGYSQEGELFPNAFVLSS